jgi:AraC-like DNA-binding protein
MLMDTSAPIARIAGLLDYASTSAFTTAFNRWTGQSPLHYRKSFRPGGPAT